MVEGSDGNFYGTTMRGGPDDVGTFFRVTPTGALMTLHGFSDASEGSAGSTPLTLGADGNFYGATYLDGPTGLGAVYRITAAGALTVLAALIQGSDGNLYSTTTRGGTEQGGAVFKVTLGGSGHQPFFSGEVNLGSDNYYLALPEGTVFGYYAYLADPHYIYHYDLGHEYVFDNTDAQSGV